MEIWKTIEGYEGYYEISNLGRVKSISRLVDNHSGFKKNLKEKILKTHISKTGYYVVDLKKKSIRKTFKVHRLIAMHFIKKIEGKNFINHIDGNKLNNNISNLEWCTIKENNYHAELNNLKNDSGHNNSRACFTESQCILIRNSKKSIKDLSIFYNVNFSTIYKIKKGITYKNSL